MLFPDVRNDDWYNEDFLDGKSKKEVLGFDWATHAVDTLFENIEQITDESDYLEKVFSEELPKSLQDEYDMERHDGEDEHREVKTYADFIRMKILSWLENERNEIVVSLIENMDESVYKALREKVLKDNEKSENPKEYYDSRHFMYTNEKRFTK